MENALEKLNTIYIISKGRPQCHTARTLQKIHYPGKWFIVCGNNDDTIDEYKKNWGEDRILVFDWYEEIKHTDTMDNLGFEKYPSGAVPARNATHDISRDRGELRHWQLDDDYNTFACYDPATGKNQVIKNGALLQKKMLQIAMFAHECKLPNAGFTLSTIEAAPMNRYKYAKRVFNAHCLPSTDDIYVRWRGRLNDDVINAQDIMRVGKIGIQFKYLSTATTPTQQEAGGLTEFYKQVGTVQKTAYAIMNAPDITELVIRFGRYHHKVDWNAIAVKIIDEKYRKYSVQ